MSHACTPILVGVTSLVLEILLLSKTAKFPFRPMDYSPWSSKKLINCTWLKKFMQVGVDVKCMHTNFGRCSFSGFGDIGYFPFKPSVIKSIFKIQSNSVKIFLVHETD